MAFLLYFAVVFVTAASVMFGLDLVTSPLPPTPDVSTDRTAHLAPAPAARVNEVAARTGDDRELSPVYPAPARSAAPRTQRRTGRQDATNEEWLPPVPQGQKLAAAPPPRDGTETMADVDNAQPAVARNNAQCDVQACGAAYRSFRAADCSYQPYDGPRRLCTRTGGAIAVAAQSQPLQLHPAFEPLMRQMRESRKSDEFSRIVRRTMPEIDRDLSVRKADGSVVVVHTGGARAQATCNVAACARAYRTFDAPDCSYQPFNGPRRLCTR